MEKHLSPFAITSIFNQNIIFSDTSENQSVNQPHSVTSSQTSENVDISEASEEIGRRQFLSMLTFDASSVLAKR